MNKRNGLYLSAMILPALLYLIWASLYLSPIVHRNNFENDFKDYYLANANGKHDIEQYFQSKINKYLDLVDLRIWSDSGAPIAKYIWIAMFSGNENVSLTSSSVHFSYLIENDDSTTGLTLIIASILYTSLLLVGVTEISHNILTYILRLHITPTISYLTYVTQHFKDLCVDARGEVVVIGYIKALLAYIPGWLIGLYIGYISGEYDIYIKSPLINPYLFVFAHLYCACAGSIVILAAQQIIRFLFMRVDIDIITSYLDDVICAVGSVAISTFVFNNGFGTTIAVTLGTLFYTVVINNRIRLANKLAQHQSN